MLHQSFLNLSFILLLHLVFVCICWFEVCMISEKSSNCYTMGITYVHEQKISKFTYRERYTWHLSALGIFSTIFHNMGKHGAFIKTAAALLVPYHIPYLNWHRKNLLTANNHSSLHHWCHERSSCQTLTPCQLLHVPHSLHHQQLHP